MALEVAISPSDEPETEKFEDVFNPRIFIKLIGSIVVHFVVGCAILISNGRIILISLYDFVTSRVVAFCRQLWQRARGQVKSTFYSEHVYKPLQEGQIRLLSIEPGNGTDPLCCTLQHVAFKSKPTYLAISYTWQRKHIWPGFGWTALALFSLLYPLGALPLNIISGLILPERIGKWVERVLTAPMDVIASSLHATYALMVSDRTCAIICNGTRMTVLENLHELLLQLRSTGSRQQYWIDAICVNQGDVTERNDQVLLMKKIYSDAQEIIAWLGPCPLLLNSPWAMGSVQSSFERADFDVNVHPAGLTVRVPLRALARYYILGRPYFSRAWVIQEFLLPEHVTFWIGQHKLSPEDMRNVINLTDLAIASVAHTICLSSVGMVDMLLRTREQFRVNRAMGLPDYLSAAFGRQATDSRDMIYAGLGLLNKSKVANCTVTCPEQYSHDRLKTPDYSAEPIDVFVGCAVTLMREIGLGALSFACMGDHHNHLIDVKLPSWVPHVSELHDYDSLNHAEDVGWSAGGSHKVIVSITPDLDLHLQSGAMAFDHVQSVYECSGNVNTIAELVHDLLAARFTYDSTGECMVTAVARTLIADVLQNSRHGPMAATEDLLRMVLRSLTPKTYQNNWVEESTTSTVGSWADYLVGAVAIQDAEKAASARAKTLRLKQAFKECGACDLDIDHLLMLCEQNLAQGIGQQGVGQSTALTQLSRSARRQDELVRTRQHVNTTLRKSQAADRGPQSQVVAAATDANAVGLKASVNDLSVDGNIQDNTSVPSKDNNPAERFLKWLLTETTPYEVAVQKRLRRRALIVTKLGYIGIGSERVKEGDIIMIMSGASIPYAVHPEDSGGDVRYHMRGEVYLHGVMDGEATRRADWEPKPIVIA